jgi:hypothetical protein
MMFYERRVTMKDIYETPVMDVIRFACEDVITTSTQDGIDNPGYESDRDND